jgi:hypothetical protein
MPQVDEGVAEEVQEEEEVPEGPSQTGWILIDNCLSSFVSHFRIFRGDSRFSLYSRHTAFNANE